MSGPLGSQQWMYASGEAVTQQSLKFNDDESQYLSWTPAAAGNRKTWTWSAWVKRGNLSSAQYVFFAYSGNNDAGFFRIEFNSTDTIRVRGWSTTYLVTSAVYRDTSAWYHIVLVADTTQSQTSSSASDSRIRLYVNGEQVTAFSSSSMPSQNTDLPINNNIVHDISGQVGYGTSAKFDGYMSDIHFIDGQALNPTSFGETVNGYWKAKDYAGTYGTNGFRLTFEDDVVSEGFNTVTYRGNGGTQSISGLGFEPDFVWIKERTSSSGHALHDSVRGAGKYLGSHSTSIENTSSTQVTSFDADGFTTGASGQTNENNQTYVSWCWDAGSGSATLNEDGSIDSTVKANPDYGFSIVKWVGDGTSQGATVGHSLGVTPDMFIVKSTDSTASWNVWHKDLTNATTSRVLLDDDSDEFDSVYVWGSTAPDNSAFGVGTVGTTTWTNKLNKNYIAYCFAEVAGYSSIGSYTTDGSTTTVNTGFKPAFVMFKRTNADGDWYIHDNTRFTLDDNNNVRLEPNTPDIEAASSTNNVDFTDTGFVINSSGTSYNPSNGEYIYMAFADTREAAFWKDVSGQGNHWTPNNLDYRDSLIDSPANNFATHLSSDSTNLTISEGNLQIYYSPTNWRSVRSTFEVSSGKWYWEVRAGGSTHNAIGIAKNWLSKAATQYVGITADSYGYFVTGRLYNNASFSTYGATYTTGDIIGVALDMDAGTLEFFKNNASQGTAVSGLSGSFTPVNSVRSANSLVANFGQDSTFAGATTAGGNQDDNGIGDFKYAPPSGYLALCTANLPTPTIIDGSEHFNTVLYNGTGSSNAVTGVGFQNDLLWIKSRSDPAGTHRLIDSVRGGSLALQSDGTGTELDNSAQVTSPRDADGFTVAGNTSAFNQSDDTYVAWNWKAGGTAVLNEVGTINSQVSANTTAGFSIVSYTGNSTDNATVGHGLNQTPDIVIIKNRDGSRNWGVWGNGGGLTSVFTTAKTGLELNTFDDIESFTTVGTDLLTTTFRHNDASFANNNSGDNYIAYCFHSVDGYSKMGSYIGGGSNFPFVFTGFRPAWVMFKRTDSAADWYLYDAKRNAYNLVDGILQPNEADEEANSSNNCMDFTSNGFKLRGSGATTNASGGTYIYLAFAETPFKYANAR